jgi:hypothetical protein
MNDTMHPNLLNQQLRRRSLLRGGVGLAAAAAGGAVLVRQAPSASAKASSDNVVIQWNNAALAAVRATVPGPTVTSRALAIMHTAMYDAWSVYEPAAVPTCANGIPKKSNGNGLGGKIQSMNYAAYRALLDLFPSQAAAFASVMKDLGENPNDNSTNTNSPQGIGNVAAAAVLSYRHADGANQLNGYKDTSGYAPVNTWDNLRYPGRWQPLNINGAVQKFTTPHWGSITPFALTSGAQFRPSGPITDVTGSAFKKQVDRIVQLSAELTDRTKTMADYWANGPHTEFPPGHWDLLSQYASAQYVSRRNKNDPNNDCLLFFALTNAVFDAGIACWDGKRAYDYARPVSAVRYLYANQQITCWGGVGKGPETMPGSRWQPYQEASVVTPPCTSSTGSPRATPSAPRTPPHPAAPRSSRASARRAASRCPGRRTRPPRRKPACRGRSAASISTRATRTDARWVGRSGPRPGPGRRATSTARCREDRTQATAL